MTDLAARIAALPPGRRHLVALAGPPAAGKSYRAERITRALADKGRVASVLPMDGFHLDDAILERRGLRARKGAPETFDLAGLRRCLEAIHAGGEVIHPVFDRAREIAIAGAGEIPAQCELVIVEGNYLLLDRPGWRDLAGLWSLSIRLAPPRDEIERRLCARWEQHGYDECAARAKLEGNDLPNARLVLRCSLAADITLE
ncbi:nucleoside/nucleotide kinase family protein [Profundibacterium mesophilum]|uniref:Fructokinase n=1 Tax=Profundibacterium mesophilum KAUST100406-0324 TaxID=1037889 RepID=A0A921NPN9_9RHOB|nr:nucleoside/nucleotide kinase family protein [Profundibacterium mesophilum]KAF0674840.1 fructokinase [Profundibacterium mesophilum KAUST100406-0324]